MTASIYVRVGPGGPRNLITLSADLFEGYDKDNPEVCETLYAGSRVEKTAELSRIKGSQNSHDKLTLKSKYSYNKADQSIYLCDEGDQRSLTNLFELLVAARHIDTEGEYVVINTSDSNPEDIQSLFDILLKDEDRLKLLSRLMEIASDDENANALAQIVSEQPGKAKYFADALNLIRKSQILDEFEKMVEQKLAEPKYQKFLEKHNWIFGSEYSAMIEDRELMMQGRLDFPMRRTADGYLEIIELKRPDHELFRKSDQRYIEKAKLVDAINQVDDYQKRVEENWQALKKKYPYLHVEKVRGKVIIGRSYGLCEEEKTALRRLNARLHGIKVITFDQLIANAQRMLDILAQEGASEPPSSVDDIPF